MSASTPPSRYLQVPVDPLILLSSPPCSPLPADWHLWGEAPPVVSEFDLDAVEGIVQLGDGRMVDLSKGEEGTFCVVRKGAVISRVVAGAGREKGKRIDRTEEDKEEGTDRPRMNQVEANKSRSDQNTSPRPTFGAISTAELPPIIVDLYE